MAGTNIIMRVTEDQKAAYEARAKELGMSVSAWLKGFADNDSSPIEAVEPAHQIVIKAPPAAEKKVIKTSVEAVAVVKEKVATRVEDGLPRGGLHAILSRANPGKVR